MDYTINEAKKIAGNSNLKYKIGAVITDKKGNIISYGFNQSKSHPKQAMYATMAGSPRKQCLHAEIHALIKCREEPHTIYVVRVSHDGKLRLAKPCEVCDLAIRVSTIKRVVYSTDTGGFEEYTV